MKIFRQIIPLLLSLCLVACHHDEPELKARRTVIMYMVAENSLSTLCDDDIREVLSAKGDIPLDCNLVVYLDDREMPKCYTYSAQTGESLLKTYPEQDSCDSLTFRNVLNDIIQEFPSEHYGLIMWSHGSGWIPTSSKVKSKTNEPKKTIGVDNNKNGNTNYGSELEIPVMRRMLEQLGVKWDYIFFDACFMQCVEVDYELRNLCDYVIGSPAEIPGEGAPYHLIMKDLFRNDNAADSIVKTYYEANKDKTYTTYYFGKVKGGLIMSAAKTSEMEDLATTMKQYVTELFANKREYDMNGIQFYCYFNSYSVWKPEYYDLGSVMNQLLASPSKYEVLTRQLERTYTTNLHTDYWLSEYFDKLQGIITDASHLASVSMFVPDSKYETVGYNESFHKMQWYKAAGWDKTGW